MALRCHGEYRKWRYYISCYAMGCWLPNLHPTEAALRWSSYCIYPIHLNHNSTHRKATFNLLYSYIFVLVHYFCLKIFSRVLRDSTLRFVGRSVRPSVRPSVRHTLLFLGFVVFGLTAPAKMINWPQKQPLPTLEREQVFIDKQKDDLDGATVPTPYWQQFFYVTTT